jgi:hypothetical protein
MPWVELIFVAIIVGAFSRLVVLFGCKVFKEKE